MACSYPQIRKCKLTHADNSKIIPDFQIYLILAKQTPVYFRFEAHMLHTSNNLDFQVLSFCIILH